MFVDASALVELLLERPRAEDILAALSTALENRVRLITSPLARFEAILSLASAKAGRTARIDPELHDAARLSVDALLEDLSIRIVPVLPDHCDRALEAAKRFHERSGSPANLNFGDCFAYATAQAWRTPILFVGRDFVHTDLKGVLSDPDPDLRR